MNITKYFLIIGCVLLLGCSRKSVGPDTWAIMGKYPTTYDFLLSDGFKKMGYNPLLKNLLNRNKAIKEINYLMPYLNNFKNTLDTFFISINLGNSMVSRKMSYFSGNSSYIFEKYLLRENVIDSLAIFDHFKGKNVLSSAFKLNYSSWADYQVRLESAHTIGHEQFYDISGEDIGINKGEFYLYDPIHHWPYFQYPGDTKSETNTKIAFVSKYDLNHSKNQRSEVLTINLIDNFSETFLAITCRNKLTYDSLNRLMSVETNYFSESRDGVETTTASSTYKHIGEYDIVETYTVKHKGKKKEVYTITYHLTPQE